MFDLAAADKVYPAVIGVSEVENRSVLEDIVAAPKLAPADYRIVHYDSPEARGVDVAFLYRPEVFKLEGSYPVKTVVPSLPNFKTRDILTMWGTIDDEPFFFMVAHWPSRLGGKDASEFKRIAVGEQMRRIADSVLKADPATRDRRHGRFQRRSYRQEHGPGTGGQNAYEGAGTRRFLQSLRGYAACRDRDAGYGDAWNLFDNIVVSGNMVSGDDGMQLRKAPGSKYYGNIFRRHYMVQQEGQYKGYPLRTYVGNNFQGGYSDHFPVYIYFAK